MGKIIGRRYRFVDDYKKTVYVGANGRPKDRITYIGEWVWPLNDEYDYKRIVLVSRIAAGIAVAALIAALLLQGTETGGKWYMAAAALSVFSLAYMVMGAVMMPTNMRPMERMRYHGSFERAKGAAIVTLIILGLSAITWLVCWILVWCGVPVVESGFSWRDIVFAVCLLIAAAASFVIVRKTKELKTEMRANASYKA